MGVPADVAAGASVDVETDASADVEADASADVEADASADVEADASVGVEADASVDVEADASADVEADASADVEADASADVEADASADVEADASAGVAVSDSADGTGASANAALVEVAPPEAALRSRYAAISASVSAAAAGDSEFCAASLPWTPLALGMCRAWPCAPPAAARAVCAPRKRRDGRRPRRSR
eukprot:scaffold41175_cov72-Phaeocystis_antarctica.AAC.3